MCKEIDEHLGHKFRVIHNLIDKYFERRWEGACHYLTRVQCATLHYLHDHSDEDVFQKDIETEFSISGATATNILKGLERQKLILREPMKKDARLKKIVLTREGMACNEQAYRNVLHMEETLSLGMTEEEVEIFRGLLDRVIVNLEGLQDKDCG